MKFGKAEMPEGRCASCDGPVVSTCVTIAFADDTGAALGTMLCGIECASAWLAAIPAAFKKMRAELSPEKAREYEKLLAAFGAEEE